MTPPDTMSRHERPLCPICRRPIQPTRNNNIHGHLDKAKHTCPGSGIDYKLALTDHLDPPKARP